MCKFLTAAVVALALYGPCVLAATHQSSSVRVGPASDEKSSSAGDEAPAPKAEKKSAADTEAARSDRKKNQKTEPAASREPGKGEPVAGGTPAVASSTNTVPPTESGNHTSTTDAPPKSNPAAIVPVSATEKKGSGEAGGDGLTSRPAPASDPAPSLKNATPAPSTTPAVPLTALYRIGAGDILDIRLLNLPDARQSTLFTVLAGGLLEYPLLPDPLAVSGMTTEEIALQLVAELRHRGVYERPQVRVSVRDYASHAVLVSGLVNDPGTKILRREAIPLYVVVAEAQPKPEAGRAIVMSHSTGKTSSVDLGDAAAMSMLVQQGDVVNLVVRPPEFFYIGGEINSPGQKNFNLGMTLTQAVLASGGATRSAGPKVKVSRQGADGRLVSAEYTLKEIEDGLVPDPPLQAGDRIEVARGKK